MDKVTLTVKEVAQTVGVSEPTVYAWTERSDFYPLLRVGRKKLILKDRFYQWLDEQAGKKHA